MEMTLNMFVDVNKYFDLFSLESYQARFPYVDDGKPLFAPNPEVRLV